MEELEDRKVDSANAQVDNAQSGSDSVGKMNVMQLVKRRFFAMRNGVLADQMRRASSPHRIIFGLNILQLREIATEFGHNTELAAALWANVTTRESRLLAPMLWRPDDLTADELVAMVKQSESTEVADNLCFELLKRRDDAQYIVMQLIDDELPLVRYAALRLILGILSRMDLSQAEAVARREAACNNELTNGLAMMVLDEIEFMRDC